VELLTYLLLPLDEDSGEASFTNIIEDGSVIFNFVFNHNLVRKPPIIGALTQNSCGEGPFGLHLALTL